MSDSFVILAKCSQKRQFARKNSYFCIFLTVFHCFSSFLCPRAICSYHSLQKSHCERIAPIALYKRATVSVSLKSLMTKERQERFALFHERIALLLTKTIDLLKKPMSEFPTLKNSCSVSGYFGPAGVRPPARLQVCVAGGSQLFRAGAERSGRGQDPPLLL